MNKELGGGMMAKGRAGRWEKEEQKEEQEIRGRMEEKDDDD